MLYIRCLKSSAGLLRCRSSRVRLRTKLPRLIVVKKPDLMLNLILMLRRLTFLINLLHLVLGTLHMADLI